MAEPTADLILVVEDSDEDVEAIGRAIGRGPIPTCGWSSSAPAPRCCPG